MMICEADDMASGELRYIISGGTCCVSSPANLLPLLTLVGPHLKLCYYCNKKNMLYQHRGLVFRCGSPYRLVIHLYLFLLQTHTDTLQQ